MASKELLRRIDERDYLTEREHREFLEGLSKDLEVLDILKENAHLYVNNVNKDVKSIQITITTCNDNFNKVEEWLDEKKV